MGQAKRRGSFEERKKQSIERKKREDAERKAKYDEWWNSLTPEEQETYWERKEKARKAFALWVLSLSGLNGYF